MRSFDSKTVTECMMNTMIMKFCGPLHDDRGGTISEVFIHCDSPVHMLMQKKVEKRRRTNNSGESTTDLRYHEFYEEMSFP